MKSIQLDEKMLLGLRSPIESPHLPGAGGIRSPATALSEIHYYPVWPSMTPLQFLGARMVLAIIAPLGPLFLLSIFGF